MNKDKLRALIAGVVVLALYHLIVFLVPFAHTTAFWLSYGFTLGAFLVSGIALFIAFLKKGDARSQFYGFPIARIGLIYLIAQLVAGVVFMALGCYIPWWVLVIVYALGLGVALLGLISVEAVVDHIKTQDVQLKKDTTLMRTLQSKMRQLVAIRDLPELKALAEEFRYCDPVSSTAIAGIETELSALVDELECAVIDGDDAAISSLCKRTTAMLGERNRLCKLNKN